VKSIISSLLAPAPLIALSAYAAFCQSACPSTSKMEPVVDTARLRVRPGSARTERQNYVLPPILLTRFEWFLITFPAFNSFFRFVFQSVHQYVFFLFCFELFVCFFIFVLMNFFLLIADVPDDVCR